MNRQTNEQETREQETQKISFENIDTITLDEKETLLAQNESQSDTSMIFMGYGILFFIVIVFMPQIYLANNIYYASKNIAYLQSQKEALKDENSELQQKLESLKFNFLTLDIEEIK